MTWLKSFLDETPGVGSLIRLVTLGAFLACIALPLGLWALLSYASGHLVEIPSTVSVFCLTGFGTATGAKVVQRFGEKEGPS